jgi:hypothetical protein
MSPKMSERKEMESSETITVAKMKADHGLDEVDKNRNSFQGKDAA